ncbi:hypothetical protein RND71_019328 [Anisodus tanguticus]|uniref:Serine carboxypeptidase n=1 Tax=Anisodus tanguticus TaxID=243964 RepID=A0AAE1RYW5_9SOLA|nr:hypothetical protein RND71_019328 [Anisodus tanguticus]
MLFLLRRGREGNYSLGLAIFGKETRTAHLGYIGVGEADEVQLFYYFIKSQSNPKVDPLILWVAGGPGCSALYAVVTEIGPVLFDDKEYDGRLPTLLSNPYAYTKVASIIFLDLPVGAGFSYATTSKANHSNNIQAADHAYQFLRKGYILGNPVTTIPRENNYRVAFTHGMELISGELYEDDCYELPVMWANDDTEREALHVRKIYKNLREPNDLRDIEGHTAPEWTPAECFAMLKMWISYLPL